MEILVLKFELTTKHDNKTFNKTFNKTLEIEIKEGVSEEEKDDIINEHLEDWTYTIFESSISIRPKNLES